MRFAFVLEYFPVLSQTFILDQITGLLDLGHTVDIYPARVNQHGVMQGVVAEYRLLDRVHHLPMPANKRTRYGHACRVLRRHGWAGGKPLLKALNGLRYGKRGWRLHLFYEAAPAIGSADYDLVLCHFGPAGLRAVELQDLGLLQGRLAVAFHGYDLTQSLRNKPADTYQPIFEHADWLLPISQRWANKLETLGAPAEKIRVHHMGIDPDRFLLKPRTVPKKTPIKLLSVARLVEKKGLDDAIRAVGQLVEAFELHYDIIGEGPEEPRLKTMIDRLGLTHQVRLLGPKPREEVLRYMAEAHLLLAPSKMASDGDEEGIPVSLMEALATGLPVLSTYHSGIPELVEDGRSGYLAEENTPDQLATKLKLLLEHHTSWPDMGHAGRARVEADFNVRRLNERLIRLAEKNDIDVSRLIMKMRSS